VPHFLATYDEISGCYRSLLLQSFNLPNDHLMNTFICQNEQTLKDEKVKKMKKMKSKRKRQTNDSPIGHSLANVRKLSELSELKFRRR